MKLTGCILLLCACGGLSLGAVQGLRARVSQLRDFLAAFEEMERELRCRLTPMPELLQTVSAHMPGTVGQFFALCADGMDRLGERPFSRLWGQALEAVDLCMEEEDRQVLEELGNSLGRYDSASQCAALARSRDRLEEHLTRALERRDRLSRVYGALGLAAGAFLIIIFM